MKNKVSKITKSVVKSTPVTHLRNWVGLPRLRAAESEIDNIHIAGTIVVYFGEIVEKSYQLEQWLPVLEELNKKHPILIIFRKLQTLRYFKTLTDLPKIFVRTLDSLQNLYASSNFLAALYVNNGLRNFQSLGDSEILHVHINHGESDKMSMVTNQAKAYDKVLIAGQAAYDRHKKVMLDFDFDKLVPIGRPQLDIEMSRELPEYEGKTVMYAPTWEGESEANNYTSLDIYGKAIIDEILTWTDTRIIYKPHPRVATSEKPEIRQVHEYICEKLQPIKKSKTFHIVAENGNILNHFISVDALITDISSVGIDFLYLHPEKPLIHTDRRSNLELLHESSPITRSTPVIGCGSDVKDLYNLIHGSDTHQSSRQEMRTYYFGDVGPGESMKNFLSTIDAFVRERKSKIYALESERAYL